MINYLPYVVIIAAIIHVVEEYFLGWVSWAQKFVPTISKSHFILVNCLFISILIISAFLSNTFITASVYSLLFINALLHIIPTVVKKEFSPGLISAVFLYIPISIFGCFKLYSIHHLSAKGLILSFVTGILLMAAPFVFQLIIMVKDKK